MNNLRKKSTRFFEIWKLHGSLGVWRRLKHVYQKNREKRNYQIWIEREKITEAARQKFREEIISFTHKPLISVVMPVYNVEEEWLRLCVESVTRQLYENWQLCIADDCSSSLHIKKVLNEYAAKDERIKVIFRETNGHISAASNSALELVTGEFVALLDHDDELAEDALFWVVKEINDFPGTEMIYSDEDLIDEKGRRYEPKFKPDWSRDLFYSLNLITHLSVYRTLILQKIGGFRVGAEGSQDYDLAMRVVEQIPEKHIRHIPKILYHWRAIRGSVAFSSDEKPYAHERARDALRSHFERTGKKAKVSQAVYNLHRVRYELPENLPKVSLILSQNENFAFTEKSVKTFIEQTDYKNFEIILISKIETRSLGSMPRKVESGEWKVERKTSHSPLNFDFLTDARFSASVPKIKILICEKMSEAERLNFAVSQTDGEILCFIDANLKPLTTDWLKELASFAYQKEIGAVGAKLLYKDETVLHGSLIIGTGRAVGVAHQHFPRDSGGSFLRAQLVNNFSAVSISCLAVRREVFEEVDGFDAEHLPNRFYDADFCLKLGKKNYRTVFMPYAELIQVDEKRRLNLQRNSTAEEENYFVRKWYKTIERDPFYNPNLSKKDASFSIDI